MTGTVKGTNYGSTEADMDGALTMQFSTNNQHAVMFADVRHCDSVNDVWSFSPLEPMRPAGKSFDPTATKECDVYPETHYPAGGASVHHFAKAGGDLARLARKQGRYILYIVPGEFVNLIWRNEGMGKTTTKEWPCAYKVEGVSRKVLSDEM